MSAVHIHAIEPGFVSPLGCLNKLELDALDLWNRECSGSVEKWHWFLVIPQF